MQSNGMIALRWTAPECFTTAQWTSLSDVYSLGVVVSEVYTWGCTPFERLEDSDMVAMINGTATSTSFWGHSSRCPQLPSTPPLVLRVLCSTQCDA